MRRPPSWTIRLVAMVAVAVAAVACGGGSSTTSVDPDPDRGAELFAANCAVCHGTDGRGAATGPPLVHERYVAEVFDDAAMRAAVERGTPQQHWTFGPMPPVAGVRGADLDDVVAFVRELQREGLSR